MIDPVIVCCVIYTVGFMALFLTVVLRPCPPPAIDITPLVPKDRP